MRRRGAVIGMLMVLVTGCGTSTITFMDSGHSKKVDPSTPGYFGPEPKMSDRSLPLCKMESGAPAFPKKTKKADYRAIVRFRIAEDGTPEDLCFARAEGPLEFEERALEARETWVYDLKFAGQKREKILTYNWERED